MSLIDHRFITIGARKGVGDACKDESMPMKSKATNGKTCEE
jgi:hypothetical protein